MALTAELKQSVILAGISMAGEVGDDEAAYDARVKKYAQKALTLVHENSPVSKSLDILEESKKFIGTILYVNKEPKTGRGLVVLKTNPTKLNPEGVETVRTEIATGNAEVTEFCKELIGLIGHRVLNYVELQTGREDATKKFRVLRYTTDLGPDSQITEDDYEAGKAKFKATAAKRAEPRRTRPRPTTPGRGLPLPGIPQARHRDLYACPGAGPREGEP